MSSTHSSKSKPYTLNECSICLSALKQGAPILTLSCEHKYHFQCLMLSIRAQHKQCPLCRATIDESIVQLIAANRNNTSYHSSRSSSDNLLGSNVESSSGLPTISVTPRLEYKGQSSERPSNIYGLVTLQANSTGHRSSSSSSRVPIDLICVVDQSASMSGAKMILLKETLTYITEQLTDRDRLAIVSFDNHAYDRSHGLKQMTEQNKHRLHRVIKHDLEDGFSTNIKCGLEMAIRLFRNRQGENPISALFLLTDGQDDEIQDYSQTMRQVPANVVCHTFGYGPDHAAALLVKIAESGNDGTFTYIDKYDAIGPAFAIALAGLLTCVAQNIRVEIEFNDGYQITHAHSIYKYEPERLPSSRITFKLNNLNADEKRNLIFQLSVPSLRGQTSLQDHVIGHVSVRYVEPNTNRTLTTTPAPFHLIRRSPMSAEYLQVDHTLDVQRNRIETALVLRQAMEEHDYNLSKALLKAQVDRIKASASAQDPFCRQLIRDLEHPYSTENDYRSTHHNIYMQHATERGTYSSASSSSAHVYSNPNHLSQIQNYQRQNEVSFDF
ncbi:unnamed protein product [Adineta ricciae]|uniref:Uncharacterized protein n=1 Tax=Adineta ricciae TaxID=249248 RepID=A0A813UBC0_ADIRI|nr:unnamed protein product [Adineta ricciae]